VTLQPDDLTTWSTADLIAIITSWRAIEQDRHEQMMAMIYRAELLLQLDQEAAEWTCPETGRHTPRWFNRVDGAQHCSGGEKEHP